MAPIYIKEWKTPYGELIIGSYGDKLCLCDWKYRKARTEIDKRIQQGLQAEYSIGDSQTIEIAKAQLSEYFLNQRTAFDIPLEYVGTEFQKRVWSALIQIPFGQRVSYQSLSSQLGDVKAIRAVATANGANAISIIVPCHRIIGSDGSLVGYAGGLPAKKKLLELERPSLVVQGSLFSEED